MFLYKNINNFVPQQLFGVFLNTSVIAFVRKQMQKVCKFGIKTWDTYSIQ